MNHWTFLSRRMRIYSHVRLNAKKAAIDRPDAASKPAVRVSWLREHTSLPLHKRDGVRPRRPVFERGLRRLFAQRSEARANLF